MPYKITNLTRNTLLADRAELANTPWKRMKGLLGRRAFEPGQALIIRPCNSIHTFFMRFPIDVLFLDRQNRVLGLYQGISPFRFSRIFWHAQTAIELPAGTLSQTNTQPDDIIQLIANQ